MKLIVGLGNPGQKYEGTRHNVGFFLLDQLQAEWQFPIFALQKKIEAEISQAVRGGEKVILVKPHTFMNLSGTAVQKILAFYKLTPEDLLVLHDDKDISCGDFRLAVESSSAGHNGVQNIIDVLGTKRFARLRVGIGNKNEDASAPSPIETSDFVLGKLTKAEQEKIEKTKPAIFQIIEKMILA
ncbi:MAG: aminoacyl-tRNA hydrolase [Candidatus Moraniibacteriota bacterium]